MVSDSFISGSDSIVNDYYVSKAVTERAAVMETRQRSLLGSGMCWLHSG